MVRFYLLDSIGDTSSSIVLFLLPNSQAFSGTNFSKCLLAAAILSCISVVGILEELEVKVPFLLSFCCFAAMTIMM